MVSVTFFVYLFVPFSMSVCFVLIFVIFVVSFCLLRHLALTDRSVNVYARASRMVTTSLILKKMILKVYLFCLFVCLFIMFVCCLWCLYYVIHLFFLTKSCRWLYVRAFQMLTASPILKWYCMKRCLFVYCLFICLFHYAVYYVTSLTRCSWRVDVRQGISNVEAISDVTGRVKVILWTISWNGEFGVQAPHRNFPLFQVWHDLFQCFLRWVACMCDGDIIKMLMKWWEN